MSAAWLAVSLAVGIMLGILFYGGLWMTVRRLMAARNPIALTLGSLLVRTAVVVAGLLLVARGQWPNALVFLAGFVMGRIAVSRFVRVCT